ARPADRARAGLRLRDVRAARHGRAQGPARGHPRAAGEGDRDRRGRPGIQGAGGKGLRSASLPHAGRVRAGEQRIGEGPAPALEGAALGREVSVLRTLAGYLSEAVMGFLALAALSLGVAPLLFALPPPLGHAVAVLEWAIIAAFALE